MPYIKRGTFPEAYYIALELLKETSEVDHLTVEVENPVKKRAPPIESLELPGEYEKLLRISASYRDFHNQFKKTEIGKQTGAERIIDRIKVLCPIGDEIDKLRENASKLRCHRGKIRKKRNGEYLSKENYKKRLLEYGDYSETLCKTLYSDFKGDIDLIPLNQLAVVLYRLGVAEAGYQSLPKGSWLYSSVSVLDPLKENLGMVADKRQGNVGQYPCLLTLDFKLTGGALNLCALWRHQYFDIKAYGNWISLTVLLKIVLDLLNGLREEKREISEIKLGKITSIACRADFKLWNRDNEDLSFLLSKVRG